MHALLARYLDGELDDNEARAFIEAVSKDPELEAELRRYEQVLAAGRSLEAPPAPAGFTHRVMDAIAELEAEVSRPSLVSRKVARWLGMAPPSPVSWRLSWAGVAAAAAVLIFTFVGGLQVGRSGKQGTAPGSPPPWVNTTAGDMSSGDQPALHVVRLVYVPHDAGVDRITVAGTFNDWDPDATALRRVNGLWSTTLVLPPGSYEYMFVEDGKYWKTDPLATITRDDGFGNANAVLDLGA